MRSLSTLLAVAALCAATGCSSTRYGNPTDVETVNVDWGRTDKQEFAKGMVQSLLDSPALSYLNRPHKGDDQRIVAVMGRIANESHEHIDTEMVSDSIRASLLQSGRFRFVAGVQGQDEIAEQVRFQQGSGRVSPEEAIAFGKQHGADVVIYGNLRSIQKKKGRSLESGGSKLEDIYYAFVLNCVNIETGEIIWANEEELTKAQHTGLFGSS